MATKIGFDYSGISDEHRKVISDHSRAITGHMRHSTKSMIDIGRRLLHVRQLLGKIFTAWIGAEFQWSIATARSYIIVSERFANLDCLDNFQPSALAALSRKHIPQTAIDQAVARARNGELITKSIACELADRIVLQAFQERQRGKSTANQEATSQIFISPMAAARAELRSTKRGRPTKNIRTLTGSVQSMRRNIHQVYEMMSEQERKSLSDELMELAKELIHEPVIEGDEICIEADGGIAEYKDEGIEHRELATA